MLYMYRKHCRIHISSSSQSFNWATCSPNLTHLKIFNLNSAKMYDIVEDGGHWKLVNDD